MQPARFWQARHGDVRVPPPPMDPQPMKIPKEILVRGPNWTGDLVMATPGFRALRAAFPEARIQLAVRDGLAPLVAGAPWFDAVWELHGRRRGAVSLWRDGWRRRQNRFDLGICLPDSFSSALLMRAAGVGRIVGYRRNGRAPLLHEAVSLPQHSGRRVMIPRERHVLALMEAVGAREQGVHLELFVTDAEATRAADLLDATGMRRDRPYVVLAPGASYGSSKVWPAESFARVGDALSESGVGVVLAGSPGERELVDRVGARMRHSAANLARALDLGSLKAIVRDARLLVCNDAGARHVAVAFGVPCCVVMGPTSIEKTALNLDLVRIFSTDVACRPCYRRECPIDHRCMTGISPDHVIESALGILAGQARKRDPGREGAARAGPAGGITEEIQQREGVG